MSETIKKIEEAVKTTGLTKSYQGRTVLKGLNLSVKAGTVFGLLGANGAGKSTAIECILGTKQADGGTALVLGCFRKWVFSFRKGITSRKSGYPSFAGKPPACMRGRQTGGSCVNVSESGIRQVMP